MNIPSLIEEKEKSMLDTGVSSKKKEDDPQIRPTDSYMRNDVYPDQSAIDIKLTK